MGFIVRAWRGETDLWVVFLIYNMAGGFLVGKLIQAAVDTGIPMWLAYLVASPYIIWIYVSIWRCAWNTENPVYGFLARAYLIVMPILIGYLYWVGEQEAERRRLQALETQKQLEELEKSYEERKRRKKSQEAPAQREMQQPNKMEQDETGTFHMKFE